VSGKSAVHEDRFLNWLRGTAFPAPPATLYLGLFLVLPAADGTGGVEVGTPGYTRVGVAFGVVARVGGADQVASLADVFFPVALSTWGAIAGIGLFDAAAGGTLLYFAPTQVPVSVGVNEQLKLPAANVTVSES
jgi:hypothetical protein